MHREHVVALIGGKTGQMKRASPLRGKAAPVMNEIGQLIAKGEHIKG